MDLLLLNPTCTQVLNDVHIEKIRTVYVVAKKTDTVTVPLLWLTKMHLVVVPSKWVNSLRYISGYMAGRKSALTTLGPTVQGLLGISFSELTVVTGKEDVIWNKIVEAFSEVYETVSIYDEDEEEELEQCDDE
jgi:hypothetical protein